MDTIKKLIENNIENGDSRNFVFYNYHVTMINDCFRRSFYNIFNPIVDNIETKKIFEVGHIFHNYVRDLLKNDLNVKLIENEKQVSIENEEYNIVGHVDNIIKINDNKIVVDVKTTSNIDNVNEVDEHYVDQIIFYMGILKIYEGEIWYIEKNTLKTKVFKIDFVDERYQKLLNRASRLHQYIKNNELPEAEYRMKINNYCNFCKYNRRCLMNSIGD